MSGGWDQTVELELTAGQCQTLLMALNLDAPKYWEGVNEVEDKILYGLKKQTDLEEVFY